MTATPTVGAVANWFGSSRMVADRIGPELGKRSLVVIPFAGAMCEIPYISAAKLIVNDKHRHVINLARVIASDELMPQLLARLESTIFHPDELRAAQAFCRGIEVRGDAGGESLFVDPSAPVDGDDTHDAWKRLVWAENYFIATWMGRGGSSGTRGEFNGSLPIRYSPNGGGSAQRFWSAVASIETWHRVFVRCEFTTDDAFDVLDSCHDDAKCGIYVDAPWPDAGDGYTHAFDDRAQRRLAAKLAEFGATRVVVRFADHPLIRELYPRDRWTWLTYPSRAQTNGSFDEVLIINGASLAGSESPC